MSKPVEQLERLQRASRIVVSISGGKDSIAMLLSLLELVQAGYLSLHQIIAHHQIVLEDWPGTVEYCEDVCNRLDIPFFSTQARYSGYECQECHNRYLVSCTSSVAPWCRVCSSRQATYLRQVESVLDLVEWRQAWPSLAVRFCTSYFKRDNFNAWARANAQLLGDSPVICMGERALESRGRAKLPEWRGRTGLKQGWMDEYRPILSWRRIEVFRKMRQFDVVPHYCYEAQGMTSHDMYEVNQEGGPRLSCVMCFLKSADQLRAGYYIQEGRAVMERALEIESATGHTIKHGESLAQLLEVQG